METSPYTAYDNSQGIKGPPSRFIHGNSKQVTQMKKEASSKHMGLTDDLFPRLQPHIYSWLKTYGKNYLYWNGAQAELVISQAELVISQAELVISEPELVKEVLKNSGKVFVKRKPTDLGSKLLGNGLVAVEGEKWVKQRKLANQVFHGESLKNMTPAMITSVDNASKVERLRSYLEGEKMFNMLNKSTIIVIRNIFATRIPFIRYQVMKSTDLKEAEELEKGIQACVMEIVKKREDKVVIGEELVDECKTFYLAGQDTVNSLLGWTVLLLSIHRDWQEKARREVIEIFGDQNPHPEGIPKLKTLNVHLFKLERFANGVAKATNYNAAAYFPFGLGPRSCVGMAFATTEAKIALSMILQRYTMTLSPAYVHRPVLLISLRPQHGIHVILESQHIHA
ncbi:Cytochrome P450 [Hibiscus syriacus]|uniref:Cytochrome P450 n=1 Tax=Hibiscus syriacus TaxID=106335 RepID=A0A6A3BCM0_HIBSY|nr:Cytochrome P450 [Hibiscus syriacus]